MKMKPVLGSLSLFLLVAGFGPAARMVWAQNAAPAPVPAQAKAAVPTPPPAPPAPPKAPPAQMPPAQTPPPAAAAKGAAATKAASAKLAPGQKVNINTASIDELQALPGIGPAKAQKIVAARPFAAPEDLMKVSGIKQGVFNKIKDSITVK